MRRFWHVGYYYEMENEMFKLKPQARYVLQHAEFGFTANLPLSSLISPAFQASRGANLASRLPVMRDAALTEALTEVS